MIVKCDYCPDGEVRRETKCCDRCGYDYVDLYISGEYVWPEA